ncbi:hypothetical protein BC833DRAFT_624198 [Globomyces pollinis-pini]|nr:hypothetical protein BC833DRAFT_624198 [Globomyces pollinis-pini]
MSISRTRSSSSSVGANSAIDNESTPIPFTPFDILKSGGFSGHRSFSEDPDSFSSFDGPLLKEGDVKGDEITRIEELVIRPGTEKAVDVCYMPSNDVISDERVCKLSKRNFKVVLSICNPGKGLAVEKMTIQCVSQVCTSMIEVTPTVINFGDTDVGTLKSTAIQIRNCSDLPSLVELRFVSKVLSAAKEELYIPAKQSIEVKIEIFPRKVNPDYRKDITIANLLNPKNDKIVQVHSTNIDKQRITFHSLFYNILTPASTHFLDFGTVIMNSPVVRSFTIENLSTKGLILELSNSMPKELKIYLKADLSTPVSGNTSRSSERREMLLESIEDRRSFKRVTKTGTNNTSNLAGQAGLPSSHSNGVIKPRRQTDVASEISADYLDLASSTGKIGNEPKSPRRRMVTHAAQLRSLRAQFTKKAETTVEAADNTDAFLSPTLEPSLPKSLSEIILPEPVYQVESSNRYPAQTLLEILEKDTGAVMTHFSTHSSEEKFVKAQQKLRKDLNELISDGQLIEANQISISPLENQTVYLILNCSSSSHSGIQGKPRKLDCSIFFKMVEFDREIKHTQFEQLLKEDDISLIPVRELMIRSVVCRSVMELGQKHINFGSLDKTERLTKRIVIRNKSEVPLLYSVRKSGSIASGDIIFSDDRAGVIRGYGKREIGFVFDPSLPGPFQEKIIIENVQNPDNNQTLIVKANIRQPAIFSIEKPIISFGSCLIDQLSPVVQTIVISNTSTKNTKIFEVRVDPQELKFQQCRCEVWFSMDGEESEHNSPKMVLSKDVEEKIEQLEQKLKIQSRKGRPEKVEKIAEKLRLLRSGKGLDDFDPENSAKDAAPPESPSLTTPKQTNSLKDFSTLLPLTSFKVKTTDTSIIFPIAARCIKSVKVYFRPVRVFDTALKFESDMEMHALEPSDDSSSFPSLSSIGLTNMVTDDMIQELNNEVCTSRIYVNEHKNLDVVKKVLVKATVCYNQAAYLQSMEEDLQSDKPEVSDNSHRHISNWVSGPSNLSILTFPNISSPEKLSPSKNSPLMTSSLSVELSVIDLGRVEINEERECYFNLSNLLDVNSTFSLETTPNIRCLSIIKPLLPNETRRFELILTVARKGKQFATVLVQDMLSKESFTVQFIFYGVLSSYLNFSLRSTTSEIFSVIDPKQAVCELDFGHCYVDAQKRFAKVVTVTVENITEDICYISTVSNLAQQCFIFSDSTLETPVGLNFAMNGHEVRKLYIALQPGLVASNPSSQRKSDKTVQNILNTQYLYSAEHSSLSSYFDCRTLIGGIRFLVSIKDDFKQDDIPMTSKTQVSPEGLVHAYTHTLKFTATIGQSFFMLSNRKINFGISTSKGNTYTSGFWIYNISPQMPLGYKLTSSSPQLTLSKYEGCLAADSDFSITNVLREWITVSVKCEDMGLFDETIHIQNLNNASQFVNINVQLFLDSGIVSVSPCGPKAARLGDVNSIVWNDVYVTLGSAISSGSGYGVTYPVEIQKKNRNISIPVYESSFEIQNLSDELVQLQPFSNRKIPFRWIVSSNGAFVVDSNASRDFHLICDEVTDLECVGNITICGSPLLLPAREKAIAVVAVPRPMLLFDDNAFHSAAEGNSFSQDGVLLLKNLDRSIFVKSLELSASYCVSLARVEPPVLDLGKIGHTTQWENISFQFTIYNLANVPLVYEIQMPDSDCIDVATKSNESESHSFKNHIGSRSSEIVECIFKPRKLESSTAGNGSVTIYVSNLYNPHSNSEIVVNYFMTQFELKFERLTSGELLLPPLTFPNPSKSLPNDIWFIISNTSEHDVKFDMGYVLSPDVENLLTVEILSRISNAAYAGTVTLGPKAQLEVKVRVTPLETARLTWNDKNSVNLTNPDGVTLGTFSVTSRSSPRSLVDTERDSNVLKLTESIPMRAVINEGKTFTLSDNFLTFHSVTLSDSDDDLSNGNPAMAAEQRQSLVISNLSSVYPLEFKVTIEYPLEFKEDVLVLEPLDCNNSGIVEPNGNLILHLTLLESSIHGVSDDLKLHFVDQNSLSRKPQTMAIKFVEDASGILSKIGGRGTESPRSSEPLPGKVSINENLLPEPMSSLPTGMLDPFQNIKSVIELKGCKKSFDLVTSKFEGLYELDLGLQDMSSTPLVKKLTLDVNGPSKVSYHIYCLNESDSSWISCSRTDGILDSLRSSYVSSSSANTISISFSVAVRGTWSSYLILENNDNSFDIKFIRVTMEVVAKQNVKRTLTTINQSPTLNIGNPTSDSSNNKVFNVYTHALDDLDSSIDVGNISFGSFYITRSIFICNREAVPLDFTLSSNLSREDDSEIVFSLSRTGSKLFNMVRIEAESDLQVFVRFLIEPSMISRNEAIENVRENRNYEIYVNCRPVKDYQKCIPFKAVCMYPQMKVSATDFVFTGQINGNIASPLKIIKDHSDHFTISNQFEESLELQIVSESMYFGLEFILGDSKTNQSGNESRTQPFMDRMMKYISLGVGEEENRDSDLASNVWKPLADNHRFLACSIEPKTTRTVRIVPLVENLNNHADYLKRQKYILEHFVLYNKNRPHEKLRLCVRLSFGHLTYFQFASDTPDHFQILECHIIRLLRIVTKNPSCLYATDVLAEEVLFLYTHIIDELIHYGTREQAAHRYLGLATLLFKILFSNPAFENGICNSNWVHQFNYYLSFFPHRNLRLDPLKQLAKALNSP